MSSSNPFDTADYEPETQKARVPPEPFSSLVVVDAAGISHPGLVRERNEDHFFVGRFGRFLETLQTNLPLGSVPPSSQEIGWALGVADGMGGASAGKEASQLAIVSLLNLILNTPDWILRLDDDMIAEEVRHRASERYIQINQRLVEQALERPGLSGFGTTLTCAYSTGRDLFVSHVGDSRVYLFRGGVLRQLTRDHTMTQAYIDQGLISRRDGAKHHLRHVLTQALGDTGADVRADVFQTTLEDGDAILLCSDGLTEVVDDEAIREVLAGGEEAQTTCQLLMSLTLANGAPDNVTVALARYRFP